jgi:CHASE2 domain-containing sensor protein
MDYPDAVGALLGQHGFNLFWFGIVTLICAFFIWRRNTNAIFLAAIVGGLADIGYFLFLDLGGFVNFVPGTVMTLFSAAAIILSFYAYFKRDGLKAVKE